jgi:hypothetical protein
MPRLPDLDPSLVLGTLTAHGVDYVVIGGLAAILHGGATITRDIDICFAPDAGNLRALGHALEDLEARLRGTEEVVPFIADAKTLQRIELLTLETRAGALDVMRRPEGAPPYAQLKRRAERKHLGAVAVLVAALDDLIAMKLAAGRTKDLAAVEELEAIKRLRHRFRVAD